VAAGKLRFHDVPPGATAGSLRVLIALAPDAAPDLPSIAVVVHVTSKNDRTVQDLVVGSASPGGVPF
jgi:hypothetical protein